jgi:hypothetical protein
VRTLDSPSLHLDLRLEAVLELGAQTDFAIIAHAQEWDGVARIDLPDDPDLTELVAVGILVTDANAH